MDNTEAILIIILAVSLTIFLVVAIIVLILIAKLIISVKRIVGKTEQMVETAGEAAELFKNAGGSWSVLKIIRNIIKVSKRKK